MAVYSRVLRNSLHKQAHGYFTGVASGSAARQLGWWLGWYHHFDPRVLRGPTGVREAKNR